MNISETEHMDVQLQVINFRVTLGLICEPINAEMQIGLRGGWDFE